MSTNGKRLFEPGNSAGLKTRFQPGQSGNPSGKPRARREFEEALSSALAGDDPAAHAKELAEILWAAARKGEPWAVQLLFARLAPQAVKVEVRGDEQQLDFNRLSDHELEILEGILERARPIAQIEGGAGAAESA